jgi:putative addiction module killer protein
MFVVEMTDIFRDWWLRLKDKRAADAVARRLRRFELGNLGDVKHVGDTVFEARIFYGPGFRFYFANKDGRIIVLLCGGDKSSQERDIEKAKTMAKEL